MINISINTANVRCSVHVNFLHALLDGAIVHCSRQFAPFAANNFWHGFGFGAVASLTSFVAMTALAKMGVDNEPIRLVLSHVVGGSVALGVTVGLASLGVMAAPISVPGAIILTASNLAFDILLIAGRSRY